MEEDVFYAKKLRWGLYLLFITFVFVVTGEINVTAVETNENGTVLSTDEQHTDIRTSGETITEVEIITLDVDEKNATHEKINQLITADMITRETKNNTESPINVKSITTTETQAYVYRIGTGTVCQISLRWSGNIMVSNYRYNSLEIKSTSLLFPTVYDTLGYRFMSAQPAALAGTVHAGTFSVPVSVSKIKLDFSGLQLYDMAGDWLSVFGIRNAPIN